MTKTRQFTDEEILEDLLADSHSIHGYFLLGDTPIIGYWSDLHGAGLLADDDNDRAKARIEFLRRQKAPHFMSHDEMARVMGSMQRGTQSDTTVS